MNDWLLVRVLTLLAVVGWTVVWTLGVGAVLTAGMETWEELACCATIAAIYVGGFVFAGYASLEKTGGES